MDFCNALLSSKLHECSGGSSLNAYSTEETLVGTWIDGKPVYRITVIGTTAAAVNVGENVRIPEMANMDALVSMTGYVFGATNDARARVPIERSDAITFWLNSGYINNKVGVGGYVSRPYYVTVEYTKTTDTATIAIPTATALMAAYEEGVNEA